MAQLTVRDIFESEKKNLRLRLVAGGKGLGSKVVFSEINRPGLAFSGYFQYFPSKRMQILGMTEFSYLRRLKPGTRRERLREFFSTNLPCIIMTKNLKPPPDILKFCEKYSTPLFSTDMETQEFISKLTFSLASELAPVYTCHGDLVEVYGVGVLIQGNSGMGKSETALELIERGHRLVADDVIKMKAEPGRTLSGSSNDMIGHHMEIRGLGIIDIKNLFGTRGIRDKKRIELVVFLEEWKKGKSYERLGLKDSKCSILGIQLPKLIIPVRPGRNLAIIIEVAAMNYRLKKMGVLSAFELNESLKRRALQSDNG